MFSNRSVSVHPDAPQSEYAGVPDDFSVFAAARSCAQVFGAVTPAVLKSGTLYQYSDLLAALNGIAYCFPPTWPSLTQAGAKLADRVDAAYVIGFRCPCWANCLIRPGCAMSAMSGGWPPAIAVASTVGTLFPTGL